MLGWLDGTPIGTIGPTGAAVLGDLAALYHRAGVLTAKLHEHGRSWPRPTRFVRRAWDCDGLLGPAPLWGPFWALPQFSRSQRELVHAARTKAQEEVAQLDRGTGTFGLIHADLVPENLLDDGERLWIIDFDDAGLGWFLFDLATPLFFHLGTESYARAHDSLVAGYCTVRTLDAADLERLRLFLLLRGLSYLGWIGSRGETEAAHTLAPMLIERTCALCQEYLHAA